MYICPWPGCGNVFPKDQQISSCCPNNDHDPFAERDEEGQPFIYDAQELLVRKKILAEAQK